MTAEHSAHAPTPGTPTLSQMLSLVAHELRAPLNTINGFLDLSLEGVAGELNEQQREFLQRARAGSEQLYMLLEDLLLIARVDSGQLKLHRSPCALTDLVDAAREDLELTAREAEISVEIELPETLPMLSADAVRLQQVLRNLLSNALHFTPAGGRVTLVARMLPVSPQQPKPLLEVRVQDTGCGIVPAYHEQIFERFFRVPRVESGRISGQGLGLAVVKLLVELHGGHVRVESVPGAGSIFLVTLDVLT